MQMNCTPGDDDEPGEHEGPMPDYVFFIMSLLVIFMSLVARAAERKKSFDYTLLLSKEI